MSWKQSRHPLSTLLRHELNSVPDEHRDEAKVRLSYIVNQLKGTRNSTNTQQIIQTVANCPKQRYSVDMGK